MTTAYRVTLKYPDGTTMFMGTVHAEEIIQIPAADKSARNGPASSNGRPADDGERMSDPQKRYLFRLLGAQGVEGKKAEEHLKSYFKVSRLIDIPKQAASTYIDQLVKDQKDATA
jgi:hypothetical protein